MKKMIFIIGTLAIFIIGFGLWSHFSRKENAPSYKKTAVVGTPNALKVSDSALQSAPPLTREQMKKMGYAIIWVEKEKKIIPVVIKIGITDGTYTEVISGDLKEGDLVIVGYQPTGKQARQAQQSLSRAFGIFR